MQFSELIDEGKAEKHHSSEFDENFIVDLKNDLQILQQIKRMWIKIET